MLGAIPVIVQCDLSLFFAQICLSISLKMYSLIFSYSRICSTSAFLSISPLYIILCNLTFQTQLNEQEGATDGLDLDIEALSTKELAYHITLFDWDLFWAVHEYELLYHTFGRHHFGKVFNIVHDMSSEHKMFTGLHVYYLAQIHIYGVFDPQTAINFSINCQKSQF